MAQKTRTAQVFDVVKVLAWVVIAVALVKFAFFPAAQEKQMSGSVDPGGSFGQMTISVGRADITNTVILTGTIQPDEPVVARATLDGNVVRTFVNDGDKASNSEALNPRVPRGAHGVRVGDQLIEAQVGNVDDLAEREASLAGGGVLDAAPARGQ